MFDIMSIFKGGQSQPQSGPMSAQQGLNPALPAPTGANNPGVPLPGTTENGLPTPPSGNSVGAPGNSDSNPSSPFAEFKDIWQTPTTPDPSQAPIFSQMDPAKVMEAAKKHNFATSITPEMLAKIQAGGTEATQAFAAAMNSVAQTVYAQSAVATTKIVEQALGKAQERYDANLPSLVKKLSANENLLAENPLLSNPAIQPLVGALQEQLVRKNPNATSAEIQSQVNAYFASLGTAFAPKPVETPASKAAKAAAVQDDWSKFFDPA